MTLEQKISILIRKYGSKSIIRDNTSSLNGTESSFNYNKVLPKQIWIDLKNVPTKNPLKSSPVNLSKWPSGSNNSVVVKIIKKRLTWIKGTNAFYDPSSSSFLSTVEDIISPDVDISYYPEVYILNTETNEYLHSISANKYNWVFDYESGCLVFPDGIPSFIKSPEFQPPAITCYKYVGRKTAVGISTDLTDGETGPTGPTGPTGTTQQSSIIWKGGYDAISTYSKNDTVIKDGVVFVKKTGPTGPTEITSAYFDSITYNEFTDGFIRAYNEQYVDSGYTTGVPYFEDLEDLSSYIFNLNVLLETQDQSIRIFDITGPQTFNSYSRLYSNRLYFNSPKKLNNLTEITLNDVGYKSFIIDGLYSEGTELRSISFMDISDSRIIDSVVSFSPNSSIISSVAFNNSIFKDITARFENSFFSSSDVNLNGSVAIDHCTFNECNVYLGDQGPNYYRINDNIYNGVIHYFRDSRFINTNFIAEYSGEYESIVIVFDKCFLNYTNDAASNGFTFPNVPADFNSSITYLFIDSIVSTSTSQFTLLDNSSTALMGTNHFTPRLTIPNGGIGFLPANGIVSRDPTFNLFLATQNSYSETDPRSATNFYYNQ
jgi:hypothetical protein